ncbi:MAG TPA: hypothetical protein VJ836_03085 [Candidatus Saccharimonadales bacterium]|nr:hypothetical protein [Candidatus Saccharimonadales bacterium]
MAAYPHMPGHENERGIFATPYLGPDNPLYVVEPYIPEPFSRTLQGKDAFALRRLFAWSGAIATQLKGELADMGPDHLADSLVRHTGWSVAYSLKNPEVALAFTHITRQTSRNPLRQRPYYVFDQVGTTWRRQRNELPTLVTKKEARFKGAVAASIYCALMDEPATAKVYVHLPRDDEPNKYYFLQEVAGFEPQNGNPGLKRLASTCGHVCQKLVEYAPYLQLNLAKPKKQEEATTKQTEGT